MRTKRDAIHEPFACHERFGDNFSEYFLSDLDERVLILGANRVAV